MINEFTKAWEENNKDLLEVFEKDPPESYEDIVKQLIEVVINPYMTKYEDEIDYPLSSGLNFKRITVINDGNYQGSILFVVPCDTYQPSVDQYFLTYVYYGSCSYCDTFEGIYERNNLYYKDETSDYKNASKEFHTLALHILQRFKKLGEEN